MTRWEYKIERLFGVVSPKETATQRLLDKAGNEGWEAVSAWPQVRDGPLGGLETLILFKRPLPSGDN